MKAYRLILSALLILALTNIKAQVSAGFAYSITNTTSCMEEATFIDTSTGNITSWFWDFGDGVVSTLQNPIHNYLSNGVYNVTLMVSDSTFQDIATVSITISNLTPLNVTVSSRNNIPCSTIFNCTGSASAIVSGGSPPYTYLWSNGDIGQTISNLCAGTYSMTVTDINNCIGFDLVTIMDSTIAVLDSTRDASCSICDGFATVIPQGGLPPFQYSWSTSDTTVQLDNLCPGTYSVTISDNNSCTWVFDSLMVSGTSSCFDTITGMVFQDFNGNCIMDSTEGIVPNARVDINPGGAVFTDQNGQYSFVTDTGTFTVSASSPYLYMDVSCPASGEHSVSFNAIGQVSSGNDFAIEVVPTQDLRASIYCGIVRPGFLQSISFTIANDGTIPMGGVVAFELDSNLTFYSVTGTTPTPDSIVGNTLYWSFAGLGMFQSLSFSFRAQVPTIPQVSLNDPISNSVLVMPLSGDITPTNNTSTCYDFIRGAYDPNDKAVTPYGDEGKITQDDTLMYYRIRFQNTGTDTAFNVVIRDTLDSNLEWSSFKMGTASHDYQVHFEEDDILVFTFNNILLPDSNVNEPGSHGHITYYMEHNGTLPIGAEIKNRAAIYFDFNPPIITNTVVSKIHEPEGEVSIRYLPTFSTRIYPNPTENHTIIDAGNTIIQRIAVMDINGKQLYYKESLNNTKHQLNLNLPSGIYLVQVYAEQGVVTKKMVVR